MLLGIDFIYIIDIFPKILSVVPYTLFIIIISGIFGLFLAILIAAIRINKVKLLDSFAKIYISFFRSTPALIHLFLVYYGLPILLKKIHIDINLWDKSVFAVISLSLFNGAYVSEILRPAYLSVNKGQHEAAESIGLTGIKKNIRIIIPQMIPIALPGLSNAFIDLIKDTSILFVIGLVDIMGKSKILISHDYGIRKLEVYITVGLIYWLINNIFAQLLRKTEKIFNFKYTSESGEGL